MLVSEFTIFQSQVSAERMSRQSVISLCAVALLASFLATTTGYKTRHPVQVEHSGNWIPADAPLVNLEVYYESFCPYCRAFIKWQLDPTVQLVGSIMNITMVPYGNAKVLAYYTCADRHVNHAEF